MTYYGYCPTQAMTGLFSIMIIGFIWLFIMFLIFGKSKSKRYRQLLTDLYVAGKIRQMAESNKIDLAQELKDFRSVVKKWRMEKRDLDESIELDIQEELEESKNTKKS